MNRAPILASPPRHFIADLTLPHGRVLYDYLRECARDQVPELRVA